MRGQKLEAEELTLRPTLILILVCQLQAVVEAARSIHLCSVLVKLNQTNTDSSNKYSIVCIGSSQHRNPGKGRAAACGREIEGESRHSQSLLRLGTCVIAEPQVGDLEVPVP